MEQADIGRTDSNAESTASGGKLILHSFPNENPSELELRRWIESAQDRLRAARLLPYALSGTPTATTEYAAKNLIPTPITGTAETITNGILSKNMQITADNADRVIAWGHRVRDKNDTIAAALQLSLRSNAPGRLAALETTHAMIAPNEHMLNGGAMFRALKGLQGHLDTEEEAKLAKKQVDFFLDPKGRLGDNVSASHRFTGRSAGYLASSGAFWIEAPYRRCQPLLHGCSTIALGSGSAVSAPPPLWEARAGLGRCASTLL